MHPQLFGSWQAYSVCLIAGEVVGTAVAFGAAHRAQVDVRRFALALLALTIAALTGAKAYGLIERGGALGAWQAELFASYRYPGALVAVTLTLIAVGRTRGLGFSAARLADLITPSFGFSMAVIRVGCLLAGCCAGTVSHVPWAIRFPARSQVWHSHVQAGLLSPDAASSLPVHPLQVYFALLSLVLGFLALWLERHKQFEGEVFLTYVTLYSGGQFLLEFVRFTPLPHVQYLSAASALVAGAILLGVFSKRGGFGPAPVRPV